jgi:hypothetical protein
MDFRRASLERRRRRRGRGVTSNRDPQVAILTVKTSYDGDTLRSVEGMFASLLGGRSPSTLVGSVIRVRGVGFYDFNHGQRGRSRNCIELHPIVAISR